MFKHKAEFDRPFIPAPEALGLVFAFTNGPDITAAKGMDEIFNHVSLFDLFGDKRLKEQGFSTRRNNVEAEAKEMHPANATADQ
jgi:hypothetical protein